MPGLGFFLHSPPDPVKIFSSALSLQVKRSAKKNTLEHLKLREITFYLHGKLDLLKKTPHYNNS